MAKIFWKLIIPILSAGLGIFLANIFNPFELEMFSFVPSDYRYEACITVYFAVADTVISEAIEYIWKKIKGKLFSEIEVIFYLPGTEPKLDMDPSLLFNDQDLAQADILVKIRGFKKHFRNMKVQIKNPAFVEIQQASRRTEVSVSEDTYFIDLEMLFGGTVVDEFEQTFRIALSQYPVDGISKANLRPEIENKSIWIRYKHNSAEVRAGER